jgi:PAS domain S-box-containing protein
MASSIALWVFTGQDKLGLDPELPPRLLVLSVLVLLAIAVVRRVSFLEKKVAEQWFLGLPDNSYAAYLLLSSDFQILGASDLAQRWLPVEDFIGKGLQSLIASCPNLAALEPIATGALSRSRETSEGDFEMLEPRSRVAHAGRVLVVSVATGAGVAGKPAILMRFSQPEDEGMLQQPAKPVGLEALLIEHSLSAKIVSNESGLIVDYNPAAEILLGYSREEALEAPMAELILPERDRASHAAMVKRFLATGESGVVNRRMELSVLHKNGHEIPVELMVSALPTEYGVYFGGELRDLRTWHALEQELRKAKIEADLANQSKSRFLAAMSHEIRTPLNALLGILSLVQADQSDPHQAELLTTAENAGKRLMSLLTNVLDYSKIESGEMSGEQQPFAPADLIQEVTDLYAPNLAGDSVTIESDLGGSEDLWLLGDRQKIGQILTNLVSNAIKFTEQGQINISLEHDGERGAGSSFRICVEDSGIGMTASQLSRIFDAFVQVDDSDRRKYIGSGLGLSISKQLAELMNGTLTVTSAPEQGSRFVLELPMILANKPEPDIAPERLAIRNPTNRRILVAEDSKPNQLVVTAMLERNGFEVDVANNGTEACAWVKKKGHGDSAYGLILMDVQMPGMDGTEAARWIRNNGYDVPIIALTAKAFVEDEKNCLEAGMNDFMTKPVDYKALLSRVDMWLGVAGSGVSLPSEKAQELRSLMGDRAFADALRVFSEDVRQRLSALDKALSAEDLEQASAQLHTLFGIYSGYGFTELQHLSKALEESCQAKLAPPMESLGRLRMMSDELLEQIEAFCAELMSA